MIGTSLCRLGVWGGDTAQERTEHLLLSATKRSLLAAPQTEPGFSQKEKTCLNPNLVCLTSSMGGSCQVPIRFALFDGSKNLDFLQAPTTNEQPPTSKTLKSHAHAAQPTPRLPAHSRHTNEALGVGARGRIQHDHCVVHLSFGPLPYKSNAHFKFVIWFAPVKGHAGS